ncbi:MAG: uroporphyrinogen decarboxylase family protein [Candidatus Humimicrobiaceae bacterium]
MISARENMLRTIRRDNPNWIPYRYDGSLTALRPSVCIKKEDGGKDDWGVMWLPTKDAEGCYTDGGPVISIDQVHDFSAPDSDFESLSEDLRNQINMLENKDTVIFSYCDFALFERAQFILGTINFLMEALENTKKVEKLLEIITDYHIKLVEAMMKTGIDGIRFCDDWGMQTAMFLNPDLWRRIIKPRLKRLYEAVKKYNGIVWQHSCGHIEEVIPDLIEIGVEIIDPCQPAANNVLMWKKKYGENLSFLGGLDTQGYLSFGSPEEVKAKTKEFIKFMSVGGGYIAAPSHTISFPVENKNAMIEAINEVNNELKNIV